MSNLNVKKEWKKWYPEKIVLNNPKKNHNIFWNKNVLKETDFYIIKKNELINQLKNSDEFEQNSFNSKSDFLKIKKNLKEKEKKYILLNSKLQDLCINFESTIAVFEKTLFSRLLKTVLIISSYIIGEKFLINKSILLKKINKIIKDDKFFLNKPRLVIHPSNKKILEKILKQSINNKWELVCNKSIDINSFKIESDNSNIDSTIYSRWKEVYRVILKEEEHL
ncbi:flagellar assembly protein FliH [Buchnera aphidicola (Aphis helianthi)]|uniref:Flagellar assembly protein FliH n=1 Tax=Buchnera aphidicola (Aphis helianthi) TaxID=2315802 RepID=A0A4D6XJK3_9GAMM|nr:FliH/SctL family protein [Buchnera aphidicola]QCI16912.1 flagellar assembly protein FliH [Buchnera aphidicola (Aphis helianthi)]